MLFRSVGTIPAHVAEAARSTLIGHMAERSVRESVRVFEGGQRPGAFEKSDRFRGRPTGGRRLRNDVRVSFRLGAGEIHFGKEALARFIRAKAERQREAG